MHRSEIVDLVVRRVRPRRMRCTSLPGGSVQLHLSSPAAIPGTNVRVVVRHAWRDDAGQHVGGRVVHVGFSVRALRGAGFGVPACTDGTLTCPAEHDPRLHEAQQLVEADGDALHARSLLLDVLDEQPGCLVAHELLGRVLAQHDQAERARAHFNAAVRLGLSVAWQVDPPVMASPVGRSLVHALVGRADLHVVEDRPEAARSDLRRALSLGPQDAELVALVRPRLAALRLPATAPFP